jgi:hypothetical protein
MAPENPGYYVDPCESAVLTRAASDRLRASGLDVAAANTSDAAELFLQRTCCLRVGRCSLRRGSWRGCRLPSHTASVTYAGLEQVGDGSLFGLEKLDSLQRVLRERITDGAMPP